MHDDAPQLDPAATLVGDDRVVILMSDAARGVRHHPDLRDRPSRRYVGWGAVEQAALLGSLVQSGLLRAGLDVNG